MTRSMSGTRRTHSRSSTFTVRSRTDCYCTYKGSWTPQRSGKKFTPSEGKTELMQVDLRRRLQEMRCGEGNDVHIHFSEQTHMREQLAGMGTLIEECDFYVIILG